MKPRKSGASRHPEQIGFWRRIGGGPLHFAIFIHVVLLVAAVMWGFQTPAKPVLRQLNHAITDGGGGDSGSMTKVRQQKLARITPSSNVKRAFAEGARSTFKLPDSGNEFNQMPALISAGGGGLGGGAGGGSGRGLGLGMGNGVGSRRIPFGPMKFAFGMEEPNPNGLVGKLYDLKQTPDWQQTQITDDGVKGVIVNFVNHGWNEEILQKYYKASKTLYQTRIAIPLMDAEQAPGAFHCEKEVVPRRWIVVYRGVVTPPKSGRYRFVGAADDVMVVRFNGRHVFDYGYCSGTTGAEIFTNVSLFKGGPPNPKFRHHNTSGYPMRIPLVYYKYATTATWNRDIGGLVAGAEFEAESGKPYPIEILISEIPGGLFCASLLIEEIGAEYQKTDHGEPILPLFRLDDSLPLEFPDADNMPPFERDGPVWKRLEAPTPI